MTPHDSEMSYGSLFARELVRALPWGIVFTLVLLIFLFGAKKSLTSTLDYALQSSTEQVKAMLLDPRIVGGVKSTVKKGISYSVMTGKDTLFRTVADPYFKDEVKKAIDYWVLTGDVDSPPWKKDKKK